MMRAPFCQHCRRTAPLGATEAAPPDLAPTGGPLSFTTVAAAMPVGAEVTVDGTGDVAAAHAHLAHVPADVALWPALTQAARRRQLTTTGRRLRSPRATLLGFLGPVALTGAAMALMVAVRFL